MDCMTWWGWRTWVLVVKVRELEVMIRQWDVSTEITERL